MEYIHFIPKCRPACAVDGWIHTTNHSPEMAQRYHPALIICPGGGYEFLSDRETHPVAEPYFSAGYNVFILSYSLGKESCGMNPLVQLAATVVYLREHSEQLYTHPSKIAICGFSAGGHLAASLGVLHNKSRFAEAFSESTYSRPDALVLAYPVITADEYAHVTSIQNVSGSNVGTEEYAWFGLDQHVDLQTPPTFLLHAADDTVVPVENSLKFAAALSSSNIPFEMHILPTGGHGLSVCTQQVGNYNPYNARWVDWSIQWLNQLFDFRN